MLRNCPTGNSMDRFEYRYAPNSNKLLSVKDDAGAAPWTTQDLEDQDPADTFDPLVSSTWNYQYDAVGNAVENELDDHVITYTAAGLVKEVRTQGGLLLTTYTYIGSGTRICKTDHDVLGVLVLRTWYAYDASGGLAATYEQPAGNTMAKQAEVTIGGSSRIGVFYRPVSNTSVYELKDHLGNVRATFKRDASLEEWTDHDAWGTPMEGRREVSTLRYRYGYQGQECEQVGTVSSISFELRTWDTRIGRWTAPDPYGQYFSPYLGMGNSPVNGVDRDGGLFIGGPAYGLFGGTFYTFYVMEVWGAVGAAGVSAYYIKGVAFDDYGIINYTMTDATAYTMPDHLYSFNGTEWAGIGGDIGIEVGAYSDFREGFFFSSVNTPLATISIAALDVVAGFEQYGKQSLTGFGLNGGFSVGAGAQAAKTSLTSAIAHTYSDGLTRFGDLKVVKDLSGRHFLAGLNAGRWVDTAIQVKQLAKFGTNSWVTASYAARARKIIPYILF